MLAFVRELKSVRYVCSYVNPDTDGVASMIALAEILAIRRGHEWTPLVSGLVNAESLVALQIAGAVQPSARVPLGGTREVALVDTHNLEQLADWIDPALVTKVIDHHTDGNASDFPNATFRLHAVGATATVILALAREYEISVSDESLRLLGAAIVSNTLNFEAPSTTPADRAEADLLRASGHLNPDGERRLNESRAAFLDGASIDVLRRDLKVFDLGGQTVIVSQIEAPRASVVADRGDVEAALTQLSTEYRAATAILNLVCLSTMTSTVVAPPSAFRDQLAQALGLEFEANRAHVGRIIMRKTDLLPAMMAPRSGP